jgi:hypothetical protein
MASPAGPAHVVARKFAEWVICLVAIEGSTCLEWKSMSSVSAVDRFIEKRFDVTLIIV